MRVTEKRDRLLAAVLAVKEAVAARTTKPVLANLLFTAGGDGTLTLTATDTELAVRFALPGLAVDRPGAAVIPPGRLVSILRETTDPDITLDADAEATKIKLTTGRFELPGGDPAEFPDPPEYDDARTTHVVPAGVLEKWLNWTAFAAETKESTRWAVTCVKFEPDDAAPGRLWLTATDTKRLSLAEVAAEPGPAAPPKGGCLLPVKAAGMLVKNLGADPAAPVAIALRANEALFRVGPVTIHTKLVEGRYPPWKDILPKKAAVKLPLDRAAFHAAIRRAAIMAEGDSKRVDFHFEPGRVVLTARGQEAGSSEVEMGLAGFDGPVVDIAFDPAFVTQMLRAVESEPAVVLEMTDGQKPAVFRVGDSYKYLAMPMTS